MALVVAMRVICTARRSQSRGSGGSAKARALSPVVSPVATKRVSGGPRRPTPSRVCRSDLGNPGDRSGPAWSVAPGVFTPMTASISTPALAVAVPFRPERWRQTPSCGGESAPRSPGNTRS